MLFLIKLVFFSRNLTIDSQREGGGGGGNRTNFDHCKLCGRTGIRTITLSPECYQSRMVICAYVVFLYIVDRCHWQIDVLQGPPDRIALINEFPTATRFFY